MLSRILSECRRWLGYINKHPFLFLVILSLALYAIITLYERHHYLGLIPKELQTSGILVIDGETAILGGCGVAAFWLNDDILNDINEQGLAFFENVTTARNPRSYTYSTYKPWKPTPVPNTTSDGYPFIGMGCAKDLPEKWKTDIYAASAQAGSYYTTSNGGTLLVLPRLKIVILDYFD